MANKRDYRSDTGRKRQPMTKKEILLQLGLCVAILVFFTVKDNFFPSAAKTSPTPEQTVAAEQKTGIDVLDATAVKALEIDLPKIDGTWRIFVVDWNDAKTFTLLSSNVTDLSMENLSKPGYDVGTSARVNVRDTDALAALLQFVPTGDKITVIGANGITVDNVTYALIADGARKSGLSASLGEWSGDVVTPTLTIEPSPTK